MSVSVNTFQYYCLYIRRPFVRFLFSGYILTLCNKNKPSIQILDYQLAHILQFLDYLPDSGFTHINTYLLEN